MDKTLSCKRIYTKGSVHIKCQRASLEMFFQLFTCKFFSFLLPLNSFIQSEREFIRLYSPPPPPSSITSFFFALPTPPPVSQMERGDSHIGGGGGGGRGADVKRRKGGGDFCPAAKHLQRKTKCPSLLLPFFDLRVGSVARCSSGRECLAHNSACGRGRVFFQLLHARFVAFFWGKEGWWRPLFPSFFYDNNFRSNLRCFFRVFFLLPAFFSLSLVIHRLPHSWLIMKNLLFSVWLCFSDKRT